MELLLVHAADVNAAGSEGSTPLHFSVFAVPVEAQLALAALLLQHGALTHLTNRHGLSPSALAKNVGRHRLAEMLSDAAKTGGSGGGGGGGSAGDARGEHVRAGPHDGGLGSQDAFRLVLGTLQGPSLRGVLDAFHSSHTHRFVRHAGGDYPVELATLHAQYAGLVSRHVERGLTLNGVTWAAAAAACERAAYDGRCSALRLRLLQQLVAVEDFESFFDLMSAQALPGAADGGRAGGGAGVGGGDADAEEVDEQRWLLDEVNGFSLDSGGENDLAATVSSGFSYEVDAAMDAAAAQHAAGGVGSRLSRTVEIDVGLSGRASASPAPLTAPSRRVSRDNNNFVNDGTAASTFFDDEYSQGGFTSAAVPSTLAPSAVGSGLPSCSATLTSFDGRSDEGLSTCSSALLGGFESRPTTLDGTLQLSGGRIVERQWTRGRRIGVGSSGEVYHVSDETSGLEFAAKLVVPRDAEAASRLEQEIELMRHMRHTNIVAYLGGAHARGERYILLEYCSGGSVRQLLERRHPTGLPDAKLASYGVQTLNGLHFLHEHMVIHRDLKGENLLLATPDEVLVKIADFGSSHELVAGATLSHDVDAIRGSPYWMSPEHILGARCGRKADVWSYACVLLEMLTGVPPWTYGAGHAPAAGQFAVFQLMSKIVESPTPPPMPSPEDMPPHVHELLSACFSRDLEQRPTTSVLLQHAYVVEAKAQGE